MAAKVHAGQCVQVLMEPQPQLMGAVVDVLITSASRWSVKGSLASWVLPGAAPSPLHGTAVYEQVISGQVSHNRQNPSGRPSGENGRDSAIVSIAAAPQPTLASLGHAGSSRSEATSLDVSAAGILPAAMAQSPKCTSGNAVEADARSADLKIASTQKVPGPSRTATLTRGDSLPSLMPTASQPQKQSLGLVDCLLYAGVVLGLAGVLLNALWTLFLPL